MVLDDTFKVPVVILLVERFAVLTNELTLTKLTRTDPNVAELFFKLVMDENVLLMLLIVELVVSKLLVVVEKELTLLMTELITFKFAEVIPAEKKFVAIMFGRVLLVENKFPLVI